IKLYTKPRVYGTLKNSSGEPLGNVDIYANSNNDWQRVKTDEEGNYELRLGYGDYSISHGWVEGYMSKYENLRIDEEVLGSGEYELNIALAPIEYNNSFKEEGNNVKADVSTTQRGKTVNIAVNYKNNGYSTVDSGTVKIELPEGIKYKAGNIEKSFRNLKRGETGQLLLTVEVLDSFQGNKIIIPAKIKVGDIEYAIGFAEIDIIDITLTAPELVPDGNFKVYGEATPGSNVTIIDKITNKVLATTKTRGRWYSADIKGLEDGVYEIFAKAEKDGNIAISQTVKVEVDKYKGIKIESIEVETSGGQKIGINPEIGVPAFTAWTGINLDGRDIKISVELSKSIDSAKFIFAGKEYNAHYEAGSWNATLSNWSATGTQQIIMEITIEDTTIRLIVGEVIILIDPSGYVYDDFTGEPIEGATVTCEVWDSNTNSWKIWDAALYGQVNPQITDKEGKYGWMVPEGIYRVRVDMEGYESRIVGDDYSIIIPPPRTDVNIGLLSLVTEYEDIVKTGFYVNRILGNQFIDIYNLLSDETNHMKTMTDAGLDNVFFVHQNGTGNYLDEILSHGLQGLRPLTDNDFTQSYREVGT
ncbi:MAG: carboxypeptidase regulatory-like domain-containing protein, partial [Tissierellia bacterium]|nr:carboxypeptidase regulatory-like domain-containing protein [Tissierellia bacterium]